MDTAIVTSVDDLIEALGGTGAARKALGGVSPQRLWNWRFRNKLPPDMYLQHKAALAGLGITASDTLWFAKAAKAGVAA